MRAHRAPALAALALTALLAAVPGTAQDAPDSPAVNVAGSPILPGSLQTEVWATTQDILSLRSGPGRSFTRLAVVPAAITLPVYGRTSDTRWIQVEYQGVRGWLAARYLVWSGDVINVVIDGIDPAPYIRRAAALAVTTRETPIYIDWVTPENRVGTIPAGVVVELTGRLGDSGDNYFTNFFRVQVRYEGALYWVGSHDLRPFDGDYRRLLDLAYLFRYGRLVLALEGSIALARGSYEQVASIWNRLALGQQVACEPVPPLVERALTTPDVGGERLFLPAVIALDTAIERTNSAIVAFRDACTDPAFVLTEETIRAQQAVLDEGLRNLLIAASLLEPLRVRNPVLNSGAP
jgi:hypothetical protein